MGMRITSIKQVVYYIVETDDDEWHTLMTDKDASNWDTRMGESWEGCVFDERSNEGQKVKRQFLEMISAGEFVRAEK